MNIRVLLPCVFNNQEQVAARKEWFSKGVKRCLVRNEIVFLVVRG